MKANDNVLVLRHMSGKRRRNNDEKPLLSIRDWKPWSLNEIFSLAI